jgi:hypothetical protein
MEELNARAEGELAALRDEQADAAKRSLAAESKKVANDEQARVAHEVAELRAVISELEIEGAKAAELRARLTANADGALLAEVERLSAELRSARAAAGGGASKGLSGAKGLGDGGGAGAGPQLTPTRPPRPTGAAPKPAAKAPAPARPQSRGKSR